jgi:hypothetical protein
MAAQARPCEGPELIEKKGVAYAAPFLFVRSAPR